MITHRHRNSPNRSRTLPLVLLGAFSALLLTSCSSPDTATADPAVTVNVEDFNGRFVATYEPAGTPATAAEETFLRERKVLDDFTDTMNEYVRIPRDVKVIAKDCGESNAFYVPDEHAIELCYELSAQERESFTSAGDSAEALDTAVYQSMVATLYHEVGHALIGELELPITGREEDVADQMAAYILTSDDESKDYLLTTADSYALAGSRIDTYDDTAFSDSHSLDAQRSVNFLCYVYGSDENTFQYLVDDGALNPDRAPDCATEYDQLVTAWETLLAPYTRE
ncbi:DUF4344 domain-containing metallopeptidase [Rhodococcus qingshengii]|uniref:DUF4344 domain-containing metallopeptidase n=1 Tax=Rhodococcus qingshengii TaxID=334542 RepID=UPI00237C6E9E|nr:DUF4344 domain-containing metallopeptidase [Rhodococcus qingshengii]WCT06007.1 DUF4344 domain-containing metallopeptidase [Rhodococcus qingshengii]